MSDTLTVTVEGWTDGERIPEKFAYGVSDGDGAMKPGENVNPAIAWSEGPAGTKSYVVLCVDTEVPAIFDDANQPGKTIAADMPRRDFYHWVLVDVPADLTRIEEGANSNDVTEGGKDAGRHGHGLNGANDYGKVKAGDMDNTGVHGGYDGPCPPWNDERMHRYVFRVLALDVESLGLSGAFGGKDVLGAMEGHVLAEGSFSGTYTLNKALL